MNTVIFKTIELLDFSCLWECSGCTARYEYNRETLNFKVCPNCGAKIEQFEDMLAETAGV
jgi:predicted RNA-binding Zn-ribbon protein involved in translation (DUF1610 family)